MRFLHCIVVARYPCPVASSQNTRWSATRWTLLLALLAIATLLVHGFHPLAEDGGLYVAGIKSLLHPELFPRTLPFVREHLRFSLFAPAIAALTRVLHVRLAYVLLALYILSIAATLYAARTLLRGLGFSDAAALAGLSLLAACWTMPVAATSLMLMDPYLTARSFTTPLTLLALGWSLTPTRKHIAGCAVALLVAAAFHPLMAFDGLALIAALALTRSRHPVRNWLLAAGLTLAAAGVVQLVSAPESAAETLAAASRYYWFLSQWHWYEDLGLLGPILVFVVLPRSGKAANRSARTQFCRALILLAALCTLVTLLFAQEHFRAHMIARLQPLRVFLDLYAVMLLLLGATVAERTLHNAHRLARFTPWLVSAAAALAFFAVARSTYPNSPQVELPIVENHNPWVEAFLWARNNTPVNALFALDAHYVNRDGEDAQTFRATAERDAIPDFSKDGGEAAIAPRLAPVWMAGAFAQQNLDAENDEARDSRLAPFAPDFMILDAETPTAHACPYRNAVVKVCSLRWP
jgi:hypothetical protein